MSEAMPLVGVAELLRNAPESHLHDGRYWFIDDASRSRAQAEEKSAGNGIKNFFKRWPRLYGLLIVIVGPSLFTGMTSKRFARTLPPDAKILHAGSGTRSFGSRCVNVDLFPFPNVQVIADLSALPFKDAVFDAVTCDQVLEHVRIPQDVTRELLRVTKPGGLIHVASPFVFPWHASPSDYSRWTLQGLASLFPGCSVAQQGVTAGPFSALTALLAYIGALLLSFGVRRLQSALEFVFLLLLCPLKLLDLLAAHIPGADLSAANLYTVVRVPPHS
jgi:SAM-dependent methyltransferase